MFVEVALPRTATGTATGTAAGRVRAARPSWVRRALAAAPPYLYILPALGCLAVWTYRPLLDAVNLSFYDWNLLPTTPKRYVGWGNYHDVIALPELRHAMLNTAWYVLGLLPFSVVLPVGIGLLTRRLGGRSRAFYRAVVFVPLLVAPVATAALWRWLLDPSGIGTTALGWFGVGAHNWLRDPATALPAMLLICGWQMLGFAVLVVSAGLAGISGEYAEAAEMDGASRGQITRWITLPLLSPTLLFLVLMTVLLSGQWTFPLIDVLTQGGPVGATTNIYYELWELGFRSFNAGLSAAFGIVFFIFFGLVAVVLVRLADRFSFHDN